MMSENDLIEISEILHQENIDNFFILGFLAGKTDYVYQKEVLYFYETNYGDCYFSE